MTPAVAVIVVLTVEGMLLFDAVTKLLPGFPPSGQGSTGGEVVEATELKIKYTLELDRKFVKGLMVCLRYITTDFAHGSEHYWSCNVGVQPKLHFKLIFGLI